MSFLRPCFRHLPAIARHRIPATPAETMRLHRLERPEPLPAALREIIAASMPENLANFYPDYAGFKSRLAAFAGVPGQRLVIGQGIESLVRDLVMLTCDPGEVFAFTAPTCAMFPLYAQIFGAQPHPINIGFAGIGVDALMWRMPEAARLLLLPNPGQPVDIAFDPAELAFLAERCRMQGTVLAIDEAYFGFGAETALPLVDRFDNVVVLRTFSKALGGAALRIGYAVGQGEILAALEGCRQSGEVSGPSIHIADAVMTGFEDIVAPMIADIRYGRDWLRAALARDGFDVRGRFANHVLVEMGSRDAAEAIVAELEERGVRVRLNPPPLDRTIMVTCGSQPLMERFHDVFSAAQQAIGERARLH